MRPGACRGLGSGQFQTVSSDSQIREGLDEQGWRCIRTQVLFLYLYNNKSSTKYEWKNFLSQPLDFVKDGSSF